MDESTKKIIEYYSRRGITLDVETAKKIAVLDRDYSTLGQSGFAVSLAAFLVKSNQITRKHERSILCTMKF